MATLGQINAQGGKYLTPEAINRALAGGAGDAAGQTHVDDWLRANPNQSDYGLAALLGGPQGINENDDTGATQMRQQQLLEMAKKYDPGAHMSEAGQAVWDQSKLPAFAGGDLKQYGGLSNLVSLSENNAGGRVTDPSRIINDPNYGAWTMRGNVGEAGNDSFGGGIGQMGKYMPYVVSAVMSAGMGAAAGPIIGALMSGTLGPGGVGNQLVMGDKVDWGRIGTNMGIAALGGLASGAGGFGSVLPSGVSDTIGAVSPYARAGMSTYNAVRNRGQNPGADIGAGISLARLFNGGV